MVSSESLLKAASSKGLPPVELWNPDYCGEIDIRIDRDGCWFYQGTPIGRRKMQILFSRIIKKEADEYFLVTPVEKVKIRVDWMPFAGLKHSGYNVGGIHHTMHDMQIEKMLVLRSSEL